MRLQLDLQAKISLILTLVIIPTLLLVRFAEHQFTQPILEEEMKQLGISAGKALAAEIVSARLLSLNNPTVYIEPKIQELVYSQPNILRVDVFAKDPISGGFKLVGSNFEEETWSTRTQIAVVETVITRWLRDENGIGQWEIQVPIEIKGRDPKGQKRILGVVFLVTSLKWIDKIVSTLWKITATAGTLSVIVLIIVLSFFLRRAIINDRLLKIAQSQKDQLATQLHESQRQLMNSEKLAVMGQLTATFAHEIGTPLTAISGHLQLLKDETRNVFSSQSNGAGTDRIEIIDHQVSRIEEIVKGFLQSTAKPITQRQLVDLNQQVEKTLGILKPRIESMGVEIKKKLDRKMGPLRVTPLETEQVLLNLVTNSLDSLKGKALHHPGSKLLIEIQTHSIQDNSKEWAEFVVYDTGEGILKLNLKDVLKPFFTTKPPGEGTGLGLTICQQIVQGYGGGFEIDSKEGVWTQVKVRIPY